MADEPTTESTSVDPDSTDVESELSPIGDTESTAVDPDSHACESDVTGSPTGDPDASHAWDTDSPIGESPIGDSETFPRAYVQQLREENARYRQRAGRADEASKRLLEVTVLDAARDHLADPIDLLTFTKADELVDGDGWPDPDRITAAATALAASKPHLAPRRPRGDIGQGAAPSSESVNLAAIMRARAS